MRIIMDGQFGSCGKGAVISVLAQQEKPDYVVRVGGPQAGHSMYGPCPPGCDQADGEHRKRYAGILTLMPELENECTHLYKMRQIPAVWHVSGVTCVIGRGAMIDLEVLKDEIEAIKLTGYKLDLMVDANAFIVEPKHKSAESADSFGKAGSTREGVGVARAHMAMRSAMQIKDLMIDGGTEVYAWLAPYVIADTAALLREEASSGLDIWIEGTQGFGLSLRASGYYPYVTSADITPAQLLADCGLHWDCDPVETTMLLRTFPIRIAGESGPLAEIDWSDLPVPPEQPEITTVTRKQRRIGSFDPEQVKRAISECRPDEIVITFLDYLKPEDRAAFIRFVEQTCEVPVRYVSLGFEELYMIQQGVPGFPQYVPAPEFAV